MTGTGKDKIKNKIVVTEEETMQSWDKYFSELETKRHRYTNILDKINELLGTLPQNPIVLDAGCGSGEYSVYMLERGCRVHGIDYSAHAIGLAQKALGEIDRSYSKSADFRVGRIEEMLCYEDESFDMILCINALHCMPADKRKLAVKELTRVLKKGGVMVLTVLSRNDMFMPRCCMPELGRETYKDAWTNMVYHFYTEEELLRALKPLKPLECREFSERRRPRGEITLHMATLTKK